MPTKGTILYVEDNSDNRKLVRRVLEVEGYVVVEAKDALQAMECIETQSIDLALMDINMPDVDGYTLTAKIKSMPRFASLPIVAVTANVGASAGRAAGFEARGRFCGIRDKGTHLIMNRYGAVSQPGRGAAMRRRATASPAHRWGAAARGCCGRWRS